MPVPAHMSLSGKDTGMLDEAQLAKATSLRISQSKGKAMPTTVIEGHEVSVDDEGFLTEYDQWDPEIAGALATAIGVNLTRTTGKLSTSCVKTSK